MHCDLHAKVAQEQDERNTPRRAGTPPVTADLPKSCPRFTLDEAARHLAHSLRGFDCWDQLDEICRDRYRRLLSGVNHARPAS